MKNRIIQVVKKEFTHLRKDPKFLRMILFAPILQLFVFGYVATTDVDDIYLAVYDSCRTSDSRELVQKFTNTGYFELVGYLQNYTMVDEALAKDKADAVLVIPPGFARNLKKGKSAKVQLLVNGVNSNNAAITFNYASNIALDYSQKIIGKRLNLGDDSKSGALVEGRDRVWFNPELKSVNFMVPGIMAVLLMIMLMPVTAMSIVREKEQGTIEQINITPLTSVELVIGKIVPFIIIGYIDITLITIVGTLWFGVTLKGSLLLLYLLSGLFIIASLGLGVFISSVSENMTQAFMGSIFFILPNMLLSGFIFPISSMPKLLQYITYILPMRYYLIIVRGIFLKASNFYNLLPQVLALALFAIGTLLAGAWLVRHSARAS